MGTSYRRSKNDSEAQRLRWQLHLAGRYYGGQARHNISKPYYESEFVPNTFESGLYVGCIFSLRHYWIATSLSIPIQVLVERYAETNQNAYLGRMEVDACAVIDESAVRVQLA